MIDVHVHLWKLERGDYHWLKPEHGLLYQDYTPEELGPLFAANGIEGAVVVQAAATVEETDYMLQLASEHEWLLGVVGWLDAGGPGFREHYERLRQNRYFKGIRLNSADLDQPTEEKRLFLAAHLRQMADDSFPVDLLIRTHQIPLLLNVMEQVPHLRVVIGHLCIAEVKELPFAEWENRLRLLAAYPGVYCKISGMLTQFEGSEEAIPYVNALIEMFGAERLLFGSDWPVALQKGSYADAVALFRESLPASIEEAAAAGISRNNAIDVYGLEL